MSGSTRWIIALALLAALGGWFAGRWYHDGGTQFDRADGLQPGDRRPELQLPDLDGRLQTLAQFDGRPLLINYWATWCPPCVRELPRLAALHARRNSDGIAVLAIAMELDPAPVRDFLAQQQLELPVWIEPPSAGDSSVRFGNRRGVLPFSVLLDAEGRIVERQLGELHEADLHDWLERLAQ